MPMLDSDSRSPASRSHTNPLICAGVTGGGGAGEGAGTCQQEFISYACLEAKSSQYVCTNAIKAGVSSANSKGVCFDATSTS
jgi:hypothetical protein